MKKVLFILFLITTTALVSEAQCPMCKASVESGIESENGKGKGLNDGILYLLATPYLAIAIIGGVWYKKRKVKA
jgi:hypothetical protein